VSSTGGSVVSHREHSRWSRWAWVAVLLTPAGVILALVVSFVVAGFLDVDLFESSSLTFGENTLAYGPASIVTLIAPTAGLVLGIRAAREGSRSGLVAAIVAGLALVAMIAWSISNLTCCWT
jgi:hypothetical protein